jgi:hypothetical protein
MKVLRWHVILAQSQERFMACFFKYVHVKKYKRNIKKV